MMLNATVWPAAAYSRLSQMRLTSACRQGTAAGHQRWGRAASEGSIGGLVHRPHAAPAAHVNIALERVRVELASSACNREAGSAGAGCVCPPAHATSTRRSSGAGQLAACAPRATGSLAVDVERQGSSGTRSCGSNEMTRCVCCGSLPPSPSFGWPPTSTKLAGGGGWTCASAGDGSSDGRRRSSAASTGSLAGSSCWTQACHASRLWAAA